MDKIMIGVYCFILFLGVSLMFFIYLLCKDDKNKINILNSSIEEIEKYNLEELESFLKIPFEEYKNRACCINYYDLRYDIALKNKIDDYIIKNNILLTDAEYNKIFKTQVFIKDDCIIDLKPNIKEILLVPIERVV